MTLEENHSQPPIIQKLKNLEKCETEKGNK